jgi:hypothetical protein
MTVLQLAAWLILYGFFCGAAAAILGKAKVTPMSWLVTLPYEVGKLFVETRGWQKDKPSEAKDKTPTILMESDD